MYREKKSSCTGTHKNNNSHIVSQSLPHDSEVGPICIEQEHTHYYKKIHTYK